MIALERQRSHLSFKRVSDTGAETLLMAFEEEGAGGGGEDVLDIVRKCGNFYCDVGIREEKEIK